MVDWPPAYNKHVVRQVATTICIYANVCKLERSSLMSLGRGSLCGFICMAHANEYEGVADNMRKLRVRDMFLFNMDMD